MLCVSSSLVQSGCFLMIFSLVVALKMGWHNLQIGFKIQLYVLVMQKSCLPCAHRPDPDPVDVCCNYLHSPETPGARKVCNYTVWLNQFSLLPPIIFKRPSRSFSHQFKRPTFQIKSAANLSLLNFSAHAAWRVGDMSVWHWTRDWFLLNMSGH